MTCGRYTKGELKRKLQPSMYSHKSGDMTRLKFFVLAYSVKTDERKRHQ